MRNIIKMALIEIKKKQKHYLNNKEKINNIFLNNKEKK
jgi:hypothetical protein